MNLLKVQLKFKNTKTNEIYFKKNKIKNGL